jgi:hypothetical protein
VHVMLPNLICKYADIIPYSLAYFILHTRGKYCLHLTEVIEKYRSRIRELEPDIEEIEKQEKGEKELRMTENQINRVQNKLQIEEDDSLRPKRTWFQTKQERLQDLGILNYICN